MPALRVSYFGIAELNPRVRCAFGHMLLPAFGNVFTQPVEPPFESFSKIHLICWRPLAKLYTSIWLECPQAFRRQQNWTFC